MRYSNRYNLPETIFSAITNEPYDYNPNPLAISVTRLIDSPKIRRLYRLHSDEIEVDVSECLWKLLGSAVHSVMERMDGNNRLLEERFKEPIDGMIVSGKFDVTTNLMQE